MPSFLFLSALLTNARKFRKRAHGGLQHVVSAGKEFANGVPSDLGFCMAIRSCHQMSQTTKRAPKKVDHACHISYSKLSGGAGGKQHFTSSGRRRIAHCAGGQWRIKGKKA